MAQMYKRISRNEMIFRRLKASDPREIYGMLLTIAGYREHKAGWVAHKFKAIFGKWPRPQSAVEMIPPDSDLLCWITAEGRKFGAKKGREERAASAGQARPKPISGAESAADPADSPVLGVVGLDV